MVRAGGGGGGGGNLERLLQVTFMSVPEGNLSLLIFFSPSPYAIVIDPYWTKEFLAATQKICRGAKAFLFFVFTHYHPIMCLPSQN